MTRQRGIPDSVYDGRKVGGVVLKINKETHHNELELLSFHRRNTLSGISYGAWLVVEALHPETKVWETHAYFEKRNIHFCDINKCGFHASNFLRHAPGAKSSEGRRKKQHLMRVPMKCSALKRL